MQAIISAVALAVIVGACVKEWHQVLTDRDLQ